MLKRYLKKELNKILIETMGCNDKNARQHLLMYINDDGKGITKLLSERLVGKLIYKLY